MEKDQINHISCQESIDEWIHQDFDESDDSQSEFDLLNKKNDSKQEKIREQRRKRRNKKFNNSIWNLKENLLYMNFLKENIALFECDKKERRIMKINVMLSNAITTRSSDQCRSHHQKMMKYHLTIPGVIQHIEKLQENEITALNISSKSQDHKILEIKTFEDVGLMREDLLYSQDYKFDSLFANGVWWDGLSI